MPEREAGTPQVRGMVFLHCFTPWGPGALYAELCLGLCRALVAPWLSPTRLDRACGAPSCPPAQSCAATEAPAAEPPAGAPAGPQPQATGAAIIPFDRARARRSPRQPS
jgi:hypothetical protein